MARRAEGAGTAKPDWYTPKALGNRLAAPEDQVRLLLRPATLADQRRAGARSVGEADIEGSEVRAGTYMVFQQELVRLCTQKVLNYEAADGSAIEDGNDFARDGETAFVKEVGDVLLTSATLSRDWCKVCGEDLPDDSKVCVNKACPSVAGLEKREVVEGEGLPSDGSSDSPGSETPSDGASAAEGRSGVRAGAASRDSGT